MIRKIICYGISLCLVGFYCFTLLSGMNPQVPMEYKMYYMDRTLVDWPGYGGLAYKPGTELNFCYLKNDENQVKRRGTGWQKLETEGCGFADPNAYVYFSELQPKDYELLVEISELEGTLTAFANNIELEPLVSVEEDIYCTVISEDCISDGKITLMFQLDDVPQECKVQKMILQEKQ